MLKYDLRVAAFTALPTIRVVQPVYHSLDGNGGQGSPRVPGSCLFNWERVFANSKGYVITITSHSVEQLRLFLSQ